MNKISLEEVVASLSCGDASLASQVLNESLSDGNYGELVIALRAMTRTVGGIQEVAEKVEINTLQLDRMLSGKGILSLSCFSAILKVMGMELRIIGIQ